MGNEYYAVELQSGFSVAVKASAETGLIYVMQNHDGSTVHRCGSTEETYPDYRYDEVAVIELVMADTVK